MPLDDFPYEHILRAKHWEEGVECMGQHMEMKKGMVPALKELGKSCRRLRLAQSTVTASHRSWRRHTGGMTAHVVILWLRDQVRRMAEVCLEEWPRLEFLFREGRRARGELWGKNYWERHKQTHEPGKEGVRGRENRLSAAASCVMCQSGLLQPPMTLRKRMILKSLCCPCLD